MAATIRRHLDLSVEPHPFPPGFPQGTIVRMLEPPMRWGEPVTLNPKCYMVVDCFDHDDLVVADRNGIERVVLLMFCRVVDNNL